MSRASAIDFPLTWPNNRRPGFAVRPLHGYPTSAQRFPRLSAGRGVHPPGTRENSCRALRVQLRDGASNPHAFPGRRSCHSLRKMGGIMKLDLRPQRKWFMKSRALALFAALLFSMATVSFAQEQQPAAPQASSPQAGTQPTAAPAPNAQTPTPAATTPDAQSQAPAAAPPSAQ